MVSQPRGDLHVLSSPLPVAWLPPVLALVLAKPTRFLLNIVVAHQKVKSSESSR